MGSALSQFIMSWHENTAARDYRAAYRGGAALRRQRILTAVQRLSRREPAPERHVFFGGRCSAVPALHETYGFHGSTAARSHRQGVKMARRSCGVRQHRRLATAADRCAHWIHHRYT